MEDFPFRCVIAKCNPRFLVIRKWDARPERTLVHARQPRLAGLTRRNCFEKERRSTAEGVSTGAMDSLQALIYQ